MKHSNSKKNRKGRVKEFFNKYFGYIVFCCVFSVLTVLVFELLPYDSPINSEFALKSNKKSDADIDNQMEMVAVNYHSQVINHKNKGDIGLELYRNKNSRQSVVNFYNQLTKNNDVTLAILQNADANNIPVSMAFALAFTESSYNCNAKNANSNKSIDRGLFQLNNRSFPNLTEDEFFDPYVSAKYGLQHLKFCLNTAGNEVSALAMYNAGTNRVKSDKTPEVTLRYVSNIMNYRTGLDILFNSQVAVFYVTDSNNMLAKANY